MLTRLEIDNFRCFEGFVWEPARKQLILGANGCGKSSMMDALSNLQRFVGGDAKVDKLFPLRHRTRWLKQPEQTYSLHAEIDGVKFRYDLLVGTSGDPRKPVVRSEMLDCGDGALKVVFTAGQVSIKKPLEPDILYSLDRGWSAISSLGEVAHSDLAHRFRRWLNSLCCFRLNPFKMGSRAEEEDAGPELDLSNFAAWYRSLSQSYPKRTNELFVSLEETLDSFDSLALQDAAERVRILNAFFQREGQKPVSFRFNELSEGQRCLICLYTILHFVLVDGRTVIIDEPENFVSLREIQPWLTAAEEIVEDSHGQLILMSHHPEFIDQLGPPCGVRFVRDGAGPVRIKPWTGDPGSTLSAAELVARGWNDD